MPTSTYPNNEIVYEALRRWVDQCLRQDESLFEPHRILWTEPTLQRLRVAFTEQADVGEGGFLDRLAMQLRDADDDVLLLFAEMLAVHLLVSIAVSGGRKRTIVATVLDMMNEPVTIPGTVDHALDFGLINPGVAYNSYRAQQLQFFIDAMIGFKAHSPELQDDLLTDPWAFKDLVFSIEHHAAYTQQLALLHMVHPATFEPIVSRKHRGAIIEAFGDQIGDVDDEDRALADIREVLDAETDGGMDTFYDSEIQRQWDPQRAAVFDDLARFSRLYPDDHLYSDERDYKLRIGEIVREVMEDSAADGWSTALVRPLVANLVHHIDGGRFREFLDAHRDLAVAQVRDLLDDDLPLVERIDEFSEVLRANLDNPVGRPGGHLTIVGALLLAADGDYAPFQITRAKEIYQLVDDAPPTEVTVGERYLDWLRVLGEVREELSARGRQVDDRLDVQGLLWQMVGVTPPEANDQSEVEAFKRWRAERLGTSVDEPPDDGSDDLPRPPKPGPKSLSNLATRLHVSESWLRRIHGLLVRKRQVIFYGPPGTGKTYIARELASYVAETAERFEVVQFHPSYSYEDFIEGFRPTIRDGAIGYALEPGPLKTLADAARDSDDPHVLLVDEINRANLPKVFGELLYLLEYRDDEIRLQYSHEPFSLPMNLLFIGTMNTADRSIALIDAALRRRFAFVPFFPHEGEIKGLLRRYLEGQERTAGLWVADALDAVNAELRDLLGGPHLQIGPSHFMVGENEELDIVTVREIWDFSIHPYIEEQLFGREDQIAKFTFDRVVARYGPDTSTVDEVAESTGSYEVGIEDDLDG